MKSNNANNTANTNNKNSNRNSSNSNANPSDSKHKSQPELTASTTSKSLKFPTKIASHFRSSSNVRHQNSKEEKKAPKADMDDLGSLGSSPKRSSEEDDNGSMSGGSATSFLKSMTGLMKPSHPSTPPVPLTRKITINKGLNGSSNGNTSETEDDFGNGNASFCDDDDDNSFNSRKDNSHDSGDVVNNPENNHR